MLNCLIWLDGQAEESLKLKDNGKILENPTTVDD